MATSFGALCNDFYINQKLALKMDLPSDRETVLHLFDGIKRVYPSMNKFRRYEGELSLESTRREASYRWLSLRQNSIRCGHVNPDTMEEAFKYHQLVSEICPYHLTISPLDVDYVELLFGFDLECKKNHDAVVAAALYDQSPLGDLLNVGNAKMLDVQPVFGMSLTKRGDLQAYFEVKTRTKNRRGNARQYRNEPISIFLTLRQYGPLEELEQLKSIGETMAEHAETLASERLVPSLLTPIARQIQASSA